MEEDIDTRKINNSFLRDHSYATEGNASPAAFRRWGRAQVADRCAPWAAGRVAAETYPGPGAGAGARLAGAAAGARHIHPGLREAIREYSSRWTRRPRELKWPSGIRFFRVGLRLEK